MTDGAAISHVVPIVPGAPVPAGEPSAREDRAKEVSRFVDLLLRATRNIRLYRHATDRFEEFLDPAYQHLLELLDRHGAFRLRLGASTLEYEGQTVYQDTTQESLTYKLYRDGVRIIAFQPGVPAAELLELVLILIEAERDGGSSADDMVTRLWKAELRGIEYVAVESFHVGAGKDSGEELELEQLVASLQRQLEAQGDDVTRIARLSAEDLDVDLGATSLLAGASPGGAPNPELEEAQQDDLLLPKMALVLFNVVELDGCSEDFEIADDGLTQIVDSALLAGDPRGAIALFRRLEELACSAADQEKQHLSGRMLDAMRERMLERHRLDTLMEHLGLANAVDESAVRDYLRLCTSDQIELLTDNLSRMERSDRRAVLIDALAEIGRDCPDLFIARLDQKSASRVRDMLAILWRIDPPDKARILETCLSHESLPVRLEGLKVLARSDAPEAEGYLEAAADDESLQMRLGAYRALAEKNPKRAFDMLSGRMTGGAYATMEPRERIAIATALGKTQLPAAFRLFDELFRERNSFFRRGRQTELRKMAVVGLEAMGTSHAFRVLARELKDPDNGREVQEACRAAALRLKTKLQGGET